MRFLGIVRDLLGELAGRPTCRDLNVCEMGSMEQNLRMCIGELTGNPKRLVYDPGPPVSAWTAYSGLDKRLVMPSVSSSYPTIGASHRRGGYEVDYASRLANGGEFPEDYRISTAGEELAIQLALERAGKDPKREAVFDDLFARNPSRVTYRDGANRRRNAMLQMTATRLRVPKRYRRSDGLVGYDDSGRELYAMEVLERGKVVGEIVVPEAWDGIVAEWDEVFGIPRAILEGSEDSTYDFPAPYTTRFRFDPRNLLQNPYAEISVWRMGSIHHNPDYTAEMFARDVDCGLIIEATMDRQCSDGPCGHSYSYDSRVGFRLIRGSRPEIEKELARDV